MEKRIIRHVKIIVLFFLAVLINMLIVSANLSLINITAESETYFNSTNSSYLTKIYSRPINMLNLSNAYQSYGEVTNLTQNNYNLTLKWNNKSVVLEFYTKNASGYKERFSEKTALQLTQLNLTTGIMLGEGIYIYNHTMTTNLSLQPYKFGYNIIINNNSCEIFENYSLRCEDQLIDFTDAIIEQGITVVLNESFIEFNASDLSYIDPTIRIAANSTYRSHTDTICYESDDGDHYRVWQMLNDIGTDVFNYCHGYIRFDLTSINNPNDIAQITDVDFIFKISNVEDNDCGFVNTQFGLLDDPERYNIDPDEESEYSALWWRLDEMSDSQYKLFYHNFEDEDDEVLFTRDITTTPVINEILQNLDGFPNNNLVIGIEGDEEPLLDECHIDLYDERRGPNPPLIVIQYIGQDLTPPITSASAKKIPSGNTYTFGQTSNEDINVTLTCDDSGGPSDRIKSGCAVTRYCLDDSSNDCIPTAAYASPVTVSTLGTTYIGFQSVDNARNTESPPQYRQIVIIKNYTKDIAMYVDNSKIWNHSGYFTTTETTPDFAEQINEALEDCISDSQGYCDIPVVLHSATPGRINISNIDIRFNITSYNWNVTSLPNSSTYKVRAQATDGVFNSSWDESDSDFSIGMANNPPQISFTSPTPSNGSQQTNPDIYVNISSSDNNQYYTFLELNRDILLWMRMDQGNSTTVFDESSYSNNGTLKGNASVISNGYWGKTAQLDGEGDYISLNKSPELQFSNQPFTIAAWAKAEQNMSTTFGRIIGADNGGTQGYRLQANMDVQKWFFSFSNGTGDFSVSSKTNITTNWTFIVGQYNGTDNIIFVNGVKERTDYVGGVSPNWSGVSEISIGRRASTNYFNGSIDEVIIFNRVLTDNEILYLYNTTQYNNNFTKLYSDVYQFAGYAVDKNGNKNSTEQRTVTASNLEIPELQLVYSNNTQKTFRFVMNNTLGSAINTIAWTFDTGQSTKSSQYNISLQSSEDAFIYIYNNYTSTGQYNIVAKATNGIYQDSKKITITV